MLNHSKIVSYFRKNYLLIERPSDGSEDVYVSDGNLVVRVRPDAPVIRQLDLTKRLPAPGVIFQRRGAKGAMLRHEQVAPLQAVFDRALGNETRPLLITPFIQQAWITEDTGQRIKLDVRFTVDPDQHRLLGFNERLISLFWRDYKGSCLQSEFHYLTAPEHNGMVLVRDEGTKEPIGVVMPMLVDSSALRHFIADLGYTPTKGLDLWPRELPEFALHLA